MAEKRVIVHFMHEDEMNEAVQTVRTAQATESYVIGVVDENEIAELEAKGLIVQTLEPPSAREETPTTRAPQRRGRGPRAAAAPPPLEIDDTGANFYLVGLSAPLLEEWREALAGHQVQLLERVPPS